MSVLPTTEEIHQMRIDALKIFCPSAIPYVLQAQRGEDDSAFMWREAFQHVFNSLIEHDRALQSLTPGGSEYVNNIERCVEFVRAQKRDFIKAKMELAAMRRAALKQEAG